MSSKYFLCVAFLWAVVAFAAEGAEQKEIGKVDEQKIIAAIDAKRKKAAEYFRCVEVEMDVRLFVPKGGYSIGSGKKALLPAKDFDAESKMSLLHSPDGYSVHYTYFTNSTEKDAGTLWPYSHHETYLKSTDKVINRFIRDNGKAVISTRDSAQNCFQDTPMLPLVYSLGFDKKWMGFSDVPLKYIEDAVVNNKECHHLQQESMGVVWRQYFEKKTLNLIREALYGDDGLLYRQTDIEYTEIDGCAYPKSWDESKYLRRQLSLKSSCNVVKIQRFDDLPVAKFENHPKPGDIIRSEINGKPAFTMIRKDGAEIPIQGSDLLLPIEVAEQKINAQIQKSWWARNWVWLVSVIVVIMFLILGLKRLKTRKNPNQVSPIIN